MSRQTHRCVNEEREKAHLPPPGEENPSPPREERASTRWPGCDRLQHRTLLDHHPWKRWRESPPGFEDATFDRIPLVGMRKEAGNPVPWRSGIAARPCTCPKMRQGAGGDKRIHHPSVCQSQIQTHPKLIITAGATECTSEPHRRGWSSPQSKLSLPASKRDLHRLPPPSFHGATKPKQHLFTEERGEKRNKRG